MNATRFDHLPLVSVVIPSLNQGHFIGDTIDSILSQDYCNIEVIVVDGASQDNTIEILKSYGDRIRWVSEPDRGESHAINKGIRLIRGDIYSRVNSDDMLEKGAVSYVVGYFTSHLDVDMIYGECLDINTEGSVIGRQWAQNPWDIRIYIRHNRGWIPTPSVFMRRKVIATVGFQDETLHHAADHDLWLRIYKAGFKIEYVPGVLARYRWHESQLTAKYQTRFLVEGFQVSARYGYLLDVAYYGLRLLRPLIRSLRMKYLSK